MTSDKKNISLLADLFVKSGLSNIVISPGSRNAPIILSFANKTKINAFSIIDERCAAFFALGIALQTNKTTAIACTSGSAALNYSSAISEAFYQKIPLLVITADRPPHLIDVGDGQTINQTNVFSNFIKKSFQLPLSLEKKTDFETAEKLINEALNNCMFPQPGPVHINIPFDEPIYNTSSEKISGNLFDFENGIPIISEDKFKEIANLWNTSKKVLIIAGQNNRNDELSDVLQRISKNKNTVILTETTSNLFDENFIDTIDNVISTISEDEIENFKPELIISFGGQVVSKMIKKFLRKNKTSHHFHISPSGEKMDTYFCLTDVIKSDEFGFFNSLKENLIQNESNYSELWINRRNNINTKRHEYLNKIEYSDFKVFDSIQNLLPENTVLHLGNSTPVRYSQLFGSKKNIEYNSNRGVSGIDGQVSTAAGYSYFSEKLNVLITGDLGFLYDSNGLMNNYLKSNFKIIVINNSGGGIFRFIPGPDSTPNLEEFFVAKHNWKAEFICKAFDVKYRKVENFNELESFLPEFLNTKNQTTELLEIFTPANKNADILREYFKFIKN
jgi:2-succinyl-5-enolpyruvyl-6-hydroxy-3-cyclohexene-1-carboxylate synthase